MKKTIALILSLAMIVSLTACGGGDSSKTESSSASSQTASASAETATPEPTKEATPEPTKEATPEPTEEVKAVEEEATTDKEDSFGVGDIMLTYSNSDSVIMTIKEYANLLANNQVKFEKVNKGATLTIIGYSQEVKGTHTINGIKFNNGYVYLTSEESPWEDKGFSLHGIYIHPTSKKALEDIDLNSIVTLSGEYYGYINNSPIVNATTELEILDE